MNSPWNRIPYSMGREWTAEKAVGRNIYKFCMCYSALTVSQVLCMLCEGCKPHHQCFDAPALQLVQLLLLCWRHCMQATMNDALFIQGTSKYLQE